MYQLRSFKASSPTENQFNLAVDCGWVMRVHCGGFLWGFFFADSVSTDTALENSADACTVWAYTSYSRSRNLPACSLHIY